ncbi:MAG: hypothetical protein ACOYL5_11985 [Phototrophicaceae bacterium]|jgi:hypothetical protein
MKAVNSWFIRLTQRGWAVALIVVLNFASFSILFALEDQFELITGVPVYDTQNDLTPSVLLEQLPLYVGDARAAYLRFAAFDYVFPLVANVFVVVIWTLLLRFNTWQPAQRLLAWQLPLFALIGTLLDWLENVSLLAVLYSGNPPVQWFVNSVIVFKRLKLASLAANAVITPILLALLIGNLIYRVYVHRRRTPQARG